MDYSNFVYRDRSLYAKYPTRFKDAMKTTLLVEREVVEAIDSYLQHCYAVKKGLHQHGNRAEFIRIAIDHEMERLGFTE